MEGSLRILHRNGSVEVLSAVDNVSLHNATYLDEPLYPVPFHIVLLLTFFYVSISVAAIVGNGLVLWVVATSRRMQSVTNCFIANLALADVIIGLFAIPFQVSIYPSRKPRRYLARYPTHVHST